MKTINIKALCTALCASLLLGQVASVAADAGAASASPAIDYNLNFGWKFKKTNSFPLANAIEDTKFRSRAFYDVKFKDKSWETVSVPHAVNAADSFDNAILDAGEQDLFRGFMLYRKWITVPKADAGKKFFIEFEAVRQTVYLYVNGKSAGYYEAGVTAIGFDITPYIVAGKENLIAVATDNMSGRGATVWTQETRPGNKPGDQSGTGYQWNTKDFNEVQGGLTGNVLLHARGTVYQTLPLYSNLKTTGTYITAKDFDFAAGSATVVADAEIRNESGRERTVTLEVRIEDDDGSLKAQYTASAAVPAAQDKGVTFATVVPKDAYDEKPTPTPTDTVDVTHIVAAATVTGLRFWSPDEPKLYTVRTILRDGTEVLDEARTVTGFREVGFDLAKGGLLINGAPIYLMGYSQRSTNEWAAIGVANDWLSDYDMRLVRESNANYIRWMHVAPKPVAIRAGDKYGVVSICPAGDKERDAEGREWTQRVEAMRDAIIYFRNSPSVWFYEAGNNAISPEHMQEMTDLRRALDPAGFRRMGCRTITSKEQVAAAEWVGTMIWRHDKDAREGMKASGNFVPMLETEFKRDESPRRSWDDYTPPDYDYRNLWLGDGGKKKDHYDIWDQTQEVHILSLASGEDGFAYFYDNRVGGATGNDYYSGAAMMVWSDSNMHGRNSGSENCRTSGRVDPVRIKKESFYAVQVMQSPVPKIHIVGHWNYPELNDKTYWYTERIWDSFYWREGKKKQQRDPLHKTVYVVATPGVARVELYVNGALVGTATEALDGFIFPIENVDVTKSGEVSAKAYDASGALVAEDAKQTAGAPAALRLTPVTAPAGFRADGSDIAFFDVAVVDANGAICPTATDRIDFKASGAGVFMGGYNSGLFDAQSVIHKNFVFAECGTNRVFVRATDKAGTFTLTASAKGLASATATVTSTAVDNTGGLSRVSQQSYPAREALASVAAIAGGASGSGTLPTAGAAGVSSTTPRRATYTVTVNGNPVTFAEAPYRPDSSTGVLCELRPVLDALKAAGVAFSYSYQTTGALPSHLAGFRLPLLTVQSGESRIDVACGETAIVIDSGADKNLTNAEFTVTAGGELVAELAAVLGYIDGVSVQTDSTARTVSITVQQ